LNFVSVGDGGDREVEDRQFGVVDVQQGFDHGSSGLEAGQKK